MQVLFEQSAKFAKQNYATFSWTTSTQDLMNFRSSASFGYRKVPWKPTTLIISISEISQIFQKWNHKFLYKPLFNVIVIMQTVANLATRTFYANIFFLLKQKEFANLNLLCLQSNFCWFLRKIPSSLAEKTSCCTGNFTTALLFPKSWTLWRLFWR